MGSVICTIVCGLIPELVEYQLPNLLMLGPNSSSAWMFVFSFVMSALHIIECDGSESDAQFHC